MSIYDKLDWQAYPVILLDFSTLSYYTPDVFRKSLYAFLHKTVEAFDICLSVEFFKEQFLELIQALNVTAAFT